MSFAWTLLQLTKILERGFIWEYEMAVSKEVVFLFSQQFVLLVKSLSVKVRPDMIFNGHSDFSALSWQEQHPRVE